MIIILCTRFGYELKPPRILRSSAEKITVIEKLHANDNHLRFLKSFHYPVIFRVNLSSTLFPASIRFYRLKECIVFYVATNAKYHFVKSSSGPIVRIESSVKVSEQLRNFSNVRQ